MSKTLMKVRFQLLIGIFLYSRHFRIKTFKNLKFLVKFIKQTNTSGKPRRSWTFWRTKLKKSHSHRKPIILIKGTSESKQTNSEVKLADRPSEPRDGFFKPNIRYKNRNYFTSESGVVSSKIEKSTPFYSHHYHSIYKIVVTVCFFFTYRSARNFYVKKHIVKIFLILNKRIWYSVRT